jgi:D-alanyl-lipoteichoic acid acyltransferase DltB (MBOAT superfamily)
MLFNSIEYIIFLPTVFLLYWFVFQKNIKYRNFFLLVISYVFYGWWDWRFLSLIIFSSFTDYFVGMNIFRSNNTGRRKLLLIISLLINLGFLGFFKYFNFFIDSFVSLSKAFGIQPNYSSLRIILPVGISFYTFQTLSYTIDVYRKKLEPTNDIIAFFAFVSFFPQLVAGPIERATNLLPQFFQRKEFDFRQAIDGSKQIVWGFFKKVVIADTCASNVEYIFSHNTGLDNVTLIFGVVFFSFQIYCDFSGYSDIAIGTAKLFGFRLMRNFNYPYFSANIVEFWKRWHISLSTWFRDYVYIPLGGNRVSKLRHIVNIVITFTVSGFWHGANWTFVLWGFLNGVAYIPAVFRKKRKERQNLLPERIYPGIKKILAIAGTYLFILFTWIFFRAKNIRHAFEYIGQLFSVNYSLRFLHDLKMISFDDSVLKSVIFIFVLVTVEWIQKDKEYPLVLTGIPQLIRWSLYYALIQVIILLGRYGSTEFIYFQF